MFVVVSYLLNYSSFQLFLKKYFSVTVGHTSRDRNTNKQRFTLRIVNIVVITRDLCLRQTSFLSHCKLHGHF